MKIIHICQLKKLFFIITILVVSHAKTQPFGQHKAPDEGATVIPDFPPPFVFFWHFVRTGTPLLMKNVLTAKNYPAFGKWSDTFLRSKYGSEEIEVERGKKENRSDETFGVKLDKFIDIYQDSDIYMVHDVPKSMAGDVSVPPTLSCGGFQHNMQTAVIWFSSGGTRSVLHYDEVDNINCLLDGRKELVLIDKKHKKLVEDRGFVQAGKYSQVDMEYVDFEKFPGLKEVPWMQVNMMKGDCLYIPYKWYHHVYSPPGRNLAVNLWFNHLLWFDKDDCDNIGEDAEPKPLTRYKMASSNEPLRTELFYPVRDNEEDITYKEFCVLITCDGEARKELWKYIDADHDDILTWEEVYSFSMDDVVAHFPGCLDRVIPSEEDNGADVDDLKKERTETTEEIIRRLQEEMRQNKSREAKDKAINVNVKPSKEHNEVDDSEESKSKIVMAEEVIGEDSPKEKQGEEIRTSESVESIDDAKGDEGVQEKKEEEPVRRSNTRKDSDEVGKQAEQKLEKEGSEKKQHTVRDESKHEEL